jgi:hypothetical protein
VKIAAAFAPVLRDDQREVGPLLAKPDLIPEPKKTFRQFIARSSPCRAERGFGVGARAPLFTTRPTKAPLARRTRMFTATLLSSRQCAWRGSRGLPDTFRSRSSDRVLCREGLVTSSAFRSATRISSVESQLRERALGDRLGDPPAHDLVRLAEGDAARRERVGQLRRERRSLDAAAASVSVDAVSVVDEPREHREQPQRFASASGRAAPCRAAGPCRRRAAAP